MLIGAIAHYFFGMTIFISSIFLILLVLVQRGRGGGLTGALGGPGGQSAFGTKAGDLFTRITVGVATVWIFLCAAAVYFLGDKDAAPQLSVTATAGGESGGMGGAENESGVGAGGSATTGSNSLDTGSAVEATGEATSSGAEAALDPGQSFEENSTSPAESDGGAGLTELGPAQDASAETPGLDAGQPAEDGSSTNGN